MSRGAQLAALLRELGGEGAGEPSDERLRDLLIAVLGAYAERVEEHDYGLPLDAEGHLDRSEVLLVVSRLLEAADLELFEVTMWRAWARS
jgi:hypothetical protein